MADVTQPAIQGEAYAEHPTPGSLEAIEDVVLEQRKSQFRHSEGLERRAGTVLGFSGVLVVLGSHRVDFLDKVGVVTAAIAGFLAVIAFSARSIPVLATKTLREKYLGQPEYLTRIRLLDTRILMLSQGADVLRRKRLLVAFALTTLIIAVGFLASGIISRWKI